MEVTVTGASGHVGANLVRTLQSQGRKVRVVVHKDRRALEELDIEQLRADILDVESLKRAMSGTEIVYHLASAISLYESDADHLYRVNVVGTRNVIDACRFCRVRRLIHFSSIHALSSIPRDEPIDESRPLVQRRVPVYDWTKAEGERLVLAAVSEGIDAVIVNPSSIIGPYDFKSSPMGTFLLLLYHGRIKALVSGGFNWVDVRDVVEGALSAEKHGRKGERYLLSGTWLSVRELSGIVERVTGRKTPWFISPLWLARFGLPFMQALSKLQRRRPLYTCNALNTLRNHRLISHEKASRELGYKPRPLVETIRDTYDWFRDMGYLDEYSWKRGGLITH